MSSIVVSGDTSGSVTLSAPAVSGSSVLTLPAVTDTLAGIAATQTLTNKTLTTPKGLQASITLGPGSGTDFKSGATFVGFGSWNQNVTVVAIDYQYIQAAQDNTVEALQYKVGGDSAVTIATFTGTAAGTRTGTYTGSISVTANTRFFVGVTSTNNGNQSNCNFVIWYVTA